MKVIANFLGCTRVPRIGERLLAIADLLSNIRIDDVASFKKSLFQRDAETSTRDACAPQKTS
jgi:hypothetical protein